LTSLVYVTITGQFLGGDETPLSGTATFTASQAVYSAGQEIVTPDVPVAAQITDGVLLAESGGALQLLATDNAGLTFLTLSGFFFWTVEVTAGGVTEPAWSFGLPSSPGTRDLFSLANMPFTAGGVSSVTAADTSVVIGGTGTAPTVRTGTLDVIAADHPPAANWSNNGHKITSLANGASAQDAAAFGQVPTSAGSIGGLLAASNLSDLANAGTARASLGLGSAATQPSSAFDAAGAASAVLALAALRANNLSDLASAPTARTNLGLGGAAVIGVPVSIANGGTGQTAQQAALDALAGAVTTAQFLRGNGTHVVLGAIQATDVPTLNQSTTGTAANFTGGATVPAYVAPHVATLTDAATVAVNAALGNDYRLLTTSGVGASRTIGAPSSPVDGQAITIDVQQASSGGPYTVTWASGAGGYSFGTDGAPTLSTGANAVDTIGFRYHAGLGKWICLGWKLGFA
jgi:hypothetical protein